MYCVYIYKMEQIIDLMKTKYRNVLFTNLQGIRFCIVNTTFRILQNIKIKHVLHIS